MTDNEIDNLVVVGKIGSPWGVRGWIKALSFTEETKSILNYQTWYLEINGKNQPFELEDGKLYRKGVVVKLEELDSPEKAKELSGLAIQIPRSDLPEPPQDEFYWSDLEGLKVIDQNGKCLGTVDGLMETGSNDVLLINIDEGKQAAIPWLPGDVITKVSLATGEIFVDWELL